MENEARTARIPSTLHHQGARRFWLAIALTGIATGLGAALLTKLLEWVQHFAWHGSATDILTAAEHASLLKHVVVLGSAALLTGFGQLLLKRLSSGNGIDTTEAIWFNAGRMPALRTLGSSVLSVIDVALGVSLGREGAPKQAGAVFANLFCDWQHLSDEQRQLLVACGAGAGMGAAYGVPLGGALFALEVMRGKLALRYVLPALFTSLIATGVSWLFLPNAPTYNIPSFPSTTSVLVWALLAGPLLGLAAVGYVRLITWADRHRPSGWGTVHDSGGRVGSARARLFLVSADSWQWQRPFAVALHGRGGVAPDVYSAGAQTHGYRMVPAQRSTGRHVYAVAYRRSAAGRRFGFRLVSRVSWKSSGIVCHAGSCCDDWCHDARAGICGGVDHGADWQRPFLCVAVVADRLPGYAGGS